MQVSAFNSMRLLVLVLVGTVLCSAQAWRPADVEHDPVQPLTTWRSLLQDALSNSDGCLSTIPKCERGACATRNVQGAARWVCLRCQGNYEPVVDSSGQDNIIQCVCSKGMYEAGVNASSCTRCPANAYCPGGDKVENPTSRGAMLRCGSNLVTRNTGARSATDCVAPAGYAMTSPTTATPCSRSQYAPQFNRLGKCIKCQGGLEEPVTSNLTDGQRSGKRTVCKVPPGKYVSQGLVRICPQGFYRENFVDFDAAVAQKCVACNPGITTAGAGAKLPAECNKVIPGYGVDSIYNITGPESIPSLPQNSSGLPGAEVCDFGFYSAGGYCAQCPAGAVTQNKGAQSIEECAIPPGYYLPAGSGTITQCPDYYYREGWLIFSSPKAANCTACGDNIHSEAREIDENPLATNGTLIRATSTSCYIEAGQGMIAKGKNSFTAFDCPVNTYGAAGKVYGLTAAPCKPCPRNMITDNQTRVSDGNACINPDGYGYASEGASRCAPGFYAAKGSRKACTRCPLGRTTADDPNLQRWISDCNVAPGFGIIGGNPANGDIYAGDLTGLSLGQILDLTIVMCPTGYYGNGDSLIGTCVKCPDGSTTKDPGAIFAFQCNVCTPGRGKVNATAPCTPCEFGFWQPGGLADCLACPASTFYPPVDGVGAAYTSAPTTFSKGSTAVEYCVPMQSQLSPEAGQAYFSQSFNDNQLSTLFTYQVSSLEECLAKCPQDMCCLVQFDAAAGKCRAANLPPAAAMETAPQLFYKLPPSTLGSASSVRQSNPSNAPRWSRSQSRASTPAASIQTATSGGVVRAQGVLDFNPRTPRIMPGSLVTVTIRRLQAASSSSSVVAAQSTQQTGPPPKMTNVRAKTIASGIYAHCAIPVTEVAAWAQVGTVLGPDARTFAQGSPVWRNASNIVECQELCDNSNVCWGGIFQDGQCLFRGGEDALKTRSFFSLPAPGSAPGLVIPFGGTYYYTFDSRDPTWTPDADRLTVFSKAVQAALPLVSPFPEATVDIWVQQGNASATEVGFAFTDVTGLPIDIDLSSLFVGNANTTLLMAKALVDLAGQAGYTDMLTTGLSIASSDGAQGLLEIPILVDGCVLLPNYCGSNGSGACSLSTCSCAPGWTGLRCSQTS